MGGDRLSITAFYTSSFIVDIVNNTILTTTFNTHFADVHLVGNL